MRRLLSWLDRAAKKKEGPAVSEKDSRRMQAEIRRVLMAEWDPIGVADEPNAKDEYDAYVGPVYDLLVGGASGEQLREYLDWVSRERMGMRDGPEVVMVRVMQALKRISRS